MGNKYTVVLTPTATVVARDLFEFNTAATSCLKFVVENKPYGDLVQCVTRSR